MKLWNAYRGILKNYPQFFPITTVVQIHNSYSHPWLLSLSLCHLQYQDKVRGFLFIHLKIFSAYISKRVYVSMCVYIPYIWIPFHSKVKNGSIIHTLFCIWLFFTLTTYLGDNSISTQTFLDSFLYHTLFHCTDT